MNLCTFTGDTVELDIAASRLTCRFAAVGVIVHTGANWAIISIGQDDQLFFNDADLFRHE